MEVLIPDFQGRLELIDIVAAEKPDIISPQYGDRAQTDA